METLKTQINQQEALKSRSLKETLIADMANQLDSNGLLIKQTGQLAEAAGMCVSLHDRHNNLMACAVVTPAESSQFQTLTGISKEELTNTVAISSVWLDPNVITAEVLPAILYFALQRGRIWGRDNVVTLTPIPNTKLPLATMLNLERLTHLPKLHSGDTELLPTAQRLKYAIYTAYTQCTGLEKDLIHQQFAKEIMQTYDNAITQLDQGVWVRAVKNHTLSKQQYTTTLFNLYQYATHASRLTARSIAHADEELLRKHFIFLFQGDLHQEKLLEKDLQSLGADLDYLRQAYVPHYATREFLMTLESTIGYQQDSLLMLACCLAAHSLNSIVDGAFKTELLTCVAGWGLANPSNVMNYLQSQNQVIDMPVLQKLITDELQQQNFLATFHSAMSAFTRSLNANVEQLSLWSSTPNI